MLLSTPGWRDKPPLLETEETEGEEQAAEGADEAENTHTHATQDSGVDYASHLEEMFGAMVEKALIARLRKGRQEIADDVISRALSGISLEVAEDAEQDVDEMLETVQGETTWEELQALLDMVGDEGFEALLLQNGILSAALGIVLRRVEAEEAAAQRDDLESGF